MTTSPRLSRRLAPVVGLVLVAFFVVLAVSKPRGEADVSSPLIGNPAPAVTSTLIGASSPAQVLDNLGVVGAPPFTADELAAIDRYAVEGGVNLWV